MDYFPKTAVPNGHFKMVNWLLNEDFSQLEHHRKVEPTVRPATSTRHDWFRLPMSDVKDPRRFQIVPTSRHHLV
jgi:hypothetical protein